MQCVKPGGIKYHFMNLWYDSTWDWTLVARTIGKHSTHLANGLVSSKVDNPIFSNLSQVIVIFYFFKMFVTFLYTLQAQ